MNKLVEAIGSCCKRNPLSEKYLLCPSLRTGQIWLDQSAVSGQPPVNVRLRTIKGLGFELADSHLRRNDLKPLNQNQAMMIINEILVSLDKQENSYFYKTRISINLISSTLDTINTLRLAGLTGDKISHVHFEDESKGLCIKRIFQEYSLALETRKLVDYAAALGFASRVVARKFDGSEDRFIMIPSDLDFSKLELDLVQAIPREFLVSLAVDNPSARAEEAVQQDSDLLVHFLNPSKAPEATGDGTASMFRALGSSNEIREVLRRVVQNYGCEKAGQTVPFDQIEILHTDYETYVPVIYETLQSVLMVLNIEPKSLPVTFAEGIPVKYSRPARALHTWLRWVYDGYPQESLIEMISDGLLDVEYGADNPPANNALAQTLRKVKIVSGLIRTGQILRDRLNQLTLLGTSFEHPHKPHHGRSKTTIEGQANEIRCLGALVSIVERLGSCSVMDEASPLELLSNSVKFLETCARSSDEMDNYALVTLTQNLLQMRQAMESSVVFETMDIRRWILELTGRLRIMGTGPRPGMIHVDNIYSGGHTGRPHIFVVGLDDERFPGSGLHDPLLMDVEREKLSGDLPQTRFEPGKRIEKFGHLLARLRGNITLSYSSLDVNADRSSFPSAVLFSMFRIISNRRDSDQTGMLEWLGLPASFAAGVKERSLTLNEWLLSALCSDDVSNKTDLVTSLKPDLMNGLTARQSRLSDNFTRYDGNIGHLFPKHDPTSPLGPIMSTASLETLGSCPLKYFFNYVLKIRPLESIDLDHSQWLDNLQLGSLLHDTFYHFMAEIINDGRPPTFERDKSRLFKLLDRQLKSQAITDPPPNKSSMRRQIIWLEKSALVFLVEEEIASREWAPLMLEASIGMKNRGTAGSFEHLEAVSLNLDRDVCVRVAGKIDRVDKRLGESGEFFRIIDYKTGSPRKYQEAKNYNRGKIVQHAIYLHMAENFLKNRMRLSSASYDFTFFFPTLRAHGIRIFKNAQECRFGAEVVRILCDIAASGVFLATDDTATCSYCDYNIICGSPSITSACSKNKLNNLANTNLDPVRKVVSNA